MPVTHSANSKLLACFRAYRAAHGSAWLAWCYMLVDIREMCAASKISFADAWLTSAVFYTQRKAREKEQADERQAREVSK
jgi:hypothetical protein